MMNGWSPRIASGPRRAVRRHVVGRLLLVEVGRVGARPLLLLRVPPHELLALRPRLAVGIGGRAVVEQPPVRRPRPRPLERRVALLPVRLAPRRLVLAVARRRRSRSSSRTRSCRPALQQLVAGERLAGRVPAVDLREHRLGARLLDLARRRVVPRQVEERPVLRILRVLQLLADHAAEVVVEPELGAAVVLRLDRLEVPLEQPLRVRERAVLLDVRGGRQEEDLGRRSPPSSARPTRSRGCRTRTTPSRSRRGRGRRASRASRARAGSRLPFAEPTAGFSPATM